MIVPCECGAKLRIDDSKIGPQGVKVRCPRCANILAVRNEPRAEMTRQDRIPSVSTAGSAAGPVVLVAHDSEVMRDTISTVLLDAGFRVETAVDGVEALRKATESKPKALILDVGLPGIYGFEICERLKASQNTSEIKIILLSSVYDMRRYKRTPVTLYGADDYIEKHHIGDYLPAKLHKLLDPDQIAPSDQKPEHREMSELPEMAQPPDREFQPSMLPDHPFYRDQQAETAPQGRAEAQPAAQPDVEQASSVLPESFSLDKSIFQKEECDIPKVDAADPAAVEKARRFARIIVSDIALYNQETVAEGLRNGTFYELLRDDVREGRDLYEKRVPEAIRKQKDYYQEAFDDFIRAQTKNVR